MAICWERAVVLAFHLCCFNFSAVLVVRVLFPFGVWGRMWNSIVSVPDHCLFIDFGDSLSSAEDKRKVKMYCCNVICGAPSTVNVKALR